MPLTLIKSDCYIAVAFDHFTLWWERNVRIIFTKATRRWRKKCARCMKANLTNNFIVKREFVIIVDHIFCFSLHALFHARLWTFVFGFPQPAKHDNDENLWFQWFIYCVWLFLLPDSILHFVVACFMKFRTQSNFLKDWTCVSVVKLASSYLMRKRK